MLQGPRHDSGHKVIIFGWQGKVVRSRPEARSPDYDNGWDIEDAEHGKCLLRRRQTSGQHILCPLLSNHWDQ